MAARPPIPDPGALEGTSVRLEPLTHAHADGLMRAQSEARDTYGFTFVPADAAAMSAYIEAALQWKADGTAFPFATIDRTSGRVVGTTRFANIVRHDWPEGSDFERGREFPDDVEIGWTWLAASAQRTPINTEAKYLMFRHAFESWFVHVVRLNTDARNQRSRNAILRIGASFEGICRGHRPSSDGLLRDTAMFSLRDFEWPAAKKALETRLGR